MRQRMTASVYCQQHDLASPFGIPTACLDLGTIRHVTVEPLFDRRSIDVPSEPREVCSGGFR
jgi:hypothetical protein